MKLRKLLKDIPVQMVKGTKEVEITGICSNSKLVSPGNLFIAKKGFTHNGAQFIADAVAAGAAAVLTDIYDPFLQDVVQVIHSDIPGIEAELAAEYYRHPSQDLFTVGITGTNGKTTCSYLIKHLMDGMGKQSGLIGTIECIVGKNYLPSTLTTPDVITNHKLLHEMASNHCQAAVMEVSSHALDQGRVKEIDFDVAVFTNLTLDHLDYHKTMEEYAAAKAKLFSSLTNALSNGKKKDKKCAVVNADSPWVEVIVKDCKEKILTYGIDKKADVWASGIELFSKGTSFIVNYQNEKKRFVSGLIGRFNVYNCLAAIAVGIGQNIPLNQILEILSTFKAAPGRLEKVANSRGLNIFVDYAHTDDALKNVLETLKEIKSSRLITVFGCGGNRDHSKRPKMAEIAEMLSDFTIVTSDNPRNEDPESIIKQIVAGFKEAKHYIVELDRGEAIKKAVKMAQGEDIILIAGKGHETYQIFAHQTIGFDDREVAAAAAAAASEA
jgi:UDP-N-acetylmuramoyl-L-alanyl-D-glutamate--2,6-diaminopimelate ligase